MKRLTTAQYDQFPGSWASNGELLALVESTEDDHNILVQNWFEELKRMAAVKRP